MEQFNYVPIGTVIAFAGQTIPIGWLPCDGRTITEVEYPDLFSVVGSVIPDLRGEFVRGLDNGRGVDASRELGSIQGEDINLMSKISHNDESEIAKNIRRIRFKEQNGNFTELGAGFASDGIINSSVAGGVGYGDGATYHQLMLNFYGEETRPRNVALNHIIKALNITTDTNTLPISTAKTLNAKIENNSSFSREVEQKHAGKEFLAYIQDPVEKKAGNLYLDRNGNGLWYCKNNTTSTVNSDTNFVDYSNLTNGNRLNSIKLVLGDRLFRGTLAQNASAIVTNISSLPDETMLFALAPNTTQTTDGNSSTMSSIITVGQLRSGVTFYLNNQNPDPSGRGCYFMWKLIGDKLKNITPTNGSNYDASTILELHKVSFKFDY